MFKWGNLDTGGRVIYVIVVICFLYGATDIGARLLDSDSPCVNQHGAPSDCDEDNAVPRESDTASRYSPYGTADPDESEPASATGECVGPVDGEPRDCGEVGAVERSVYEEAHGG